MSDAVRALKDKAVELTTKGKLQAALETWQKVRAAAPDDVAALQKMAELLVKLSRRPDAITAYEEVAERYAKMGLFFKATAVCRVILGLEPGHIRTQETIAALYARAREVPGKTMPRAAEAPPPMPAAAPPPPPSDAGLADELEIDIEVELAPPASPSLPTIPLFSTLTPAELKEVLATAMEVRSFATGEVLLHEGAPGDAMLALAEGSVGIFRGYGTPLQRRVAGSTAGDILGEVALISGAPRVATVTAESDVVALEMSRAALAQVATRFPRVKQALSQFYRERLLANALRANPVLRALPEGDQRGLARAFRSCSFAPGATIIAEGQPVDAVHMVLRGTCAVTHQSGAAYPELHEGDLFGEISLLTGGAATASVTAQGPVLAVRIPAGDFRARVLSEPGAALAVKKLAAERLARTAALDRLAPVAVTALEQDLRV